MAGRGSDWQGKVWFGMNFMEWFGSVRRGMVRSGADNIGG